MSAAELVKPLHDWAMACACSFATPRARHLADDVEVATGVWTTSNASRRPPGNAGVLLMQLAPMPMQAANMVQAARLTGVREVVVLSSIGTRLHPFPLIGARIAASKAVIRHADLDPTFRYPNTSMTYALAWAPSIREQGSVVDATDPGAYAARRSIPHRADRSVRAGGGRPCGHSHLLRRGGLARSSNERSRQSRGVGHSRCRESERYRAKIVSRLVRAQRGRFPLKGERVTRCR